jgi:hypothetical protein
MAEIKVNVLSEIDSLKQENAKLRSQFYEMKSEVDACRMVSPVWGGASLQSKIQRQAKALTNLNRRVRTQRLILRELNEHHAELANDLYHTVVDKYAAELDDETTLIF